MREAVPTAATYDYIVRHFCQEESELLTRMRRRADAASMPPIMISEEQARFLRLLLRSVGAKHVLDVGTLFGYSAAIMANAVGDQGHVVTLELNPAFADVARDNLQDEQLDGRVDVLEGPALATMKTLPSSTFDFVLIDADKENYVNYLEEALRCLGPRGLVAADNAFAFGQVGRPAPKGPPNPDVEAIERFNRHLAAHPRLEALIVPVGDGLALARIKG